ncbi:MAG: polymer-forming cytoskeletal protein, partial [Gammaproteobacteria bacterium]
VTGNVTAEDDASMLILSENGQINGEVHVPNQVINGMVEGDVYASEHIELATKARIQGNVYYNLIEMAVGAEINGNLVHQKGGKPKLEYKQGQPAGEQHEQQAAGGNS